MLKQDDRAITPGTIIKTIGTFNVQHIGLESGGVIYRMQYNDVFIYLGRALRLNGWSNILTSTGLLGCIPFVRLDEIGIVV